MNTVGIAANLAALLAAVGVEIKDPLWETVLEIAAGLIAIGGIVWGVTHRQPE